MSDPQPNSTFVSPHADLITSLSFSSTGILATASLDGHVSLQTSENGEWSEIAAFRANEGPVTKAVWCPREYRSSVIVTLGGAQIRIWESNEGFSNAPLAYSKVATLVDARASVKDAAFLPGDLGLKLATIAADSQLRVYECLDPLSSTGLATWSLTDSIDLPSLPLHACTSASHLAPPSVSTPGAGPLGASTSINALSQSIPSRPSNIESDAGWAVATCPDPWWGECIAASSGREGHIRIFQLSQPLHWAQPLVLQPPPKSSSPIVTLSWSPTTGRSYALLAAGTLSGHVQIWKIFPPDSSMVGDEARWTGDLLADLDEHIKDNAPAGGVTKVEFNITGTVLSTSGSDGLVRLWKAKYSGEWTCVSTLSCEEDNIQDVVKNGMHDGITMQLDVGR